MTKRGINVRGPKGKRGLNFEGCFVQEMSMYGFIKRSNCGNFSYTPSCSISVLLIDWLLVLFGSEGGNHFVDDTRVPDFNRN